MNESSQNVTVKKTHMKKKAWLSKKTVQIRTNRFNQSFQTSKVLLYVRLFSVNGAHLGFQCLN